MPRIPFARFRRELLSLYDPPLRRKATRQKMAQVLAELEQLGARSTADLTPALIARFATWPDRSPATVNGLLGYARAACRYAVGMGYLRIDPFSVRRFEVADHDQAEPFDRHRTPEQIRRILAQADAEAGDWPRRRLRALVYTYAYTGMRKTEALGLRVEDLDVPGRILWLRSHARRPLKTRKSGQPLAIAPDLAEVLADWIPDSGGIWVFPGKSRRGPWLSGSPGEKPLDQIRDLAGRAGVHAFTILDFRHTLATLAEGWGLGELELQRWLRHTSTRTQKHYRKPDLDQIRGTALKIRFPEPPEAIRPADRSSA